MKKKIHVTLLTWGHEYFILIIEELLRSDSICTMMKKQANRTSDILSRSGRRTPRAVVCWSQAILQSYNFKYAQQWTKDQGSQNLFEYVSADLHSVALFDNSEANPSPFLKLPWLCPACDPAPLSVRLKPHQNQCSQIVWLDTRDPLDYTAS